MEFKKEMKEIKGYVENIIYKNDDNGYCVCEINHENELVTMVGSMPSLCEGEEVKAFGYWTVHQSFGEQFKVIGIERTMPASGGAILRFLESGGISGVGPVTAKRLVDAFGKDTLLVIQNNPERLLEIKGMTKKRAEKIQNRLKEQFFMREAIEFLAGLGLTPVESVLAYQKFGGATVEEITKNPYVLCNGTNSIEFERADDAALKLGGDYNEFRKRAAVLHIVRHNLKNGHTYLPYDKLLSVCCDFLECDEETACQILENLCRDSELVITKIEGSDGVYLTEMFCAEAYIASKLALLCQNTNTSCEDKEIAGIEQQNGVQYAPLQKKAVKIAMSKGVFVLTGGPGTGKTTIIKAIISACGQRGEKVALAAPTGRAAKRMSELCAFEAKTIHRLLCMEYAKDGVLRFSKDEKNPLKADVVIIDECSMVDTLLFTALLRAIKPTARLILVGDADQLPSIGAGNVFSDIIESDCIDFIALTEIFRQAKDSLIVVNAHVINRGDYPDVTTKSSDFFFLPCQSEQELEGLIVSLCKDRLPKAYQIDGISQVQIICPTKKTLAGTSNLNRILQNTLNPFKPEKDELVFRDTTFRKGDKVMQVKNNYNLTWKKEDGEEGAGVFNGDVGMVLAADRGIKSVMVAFDDRVVEYPYELLSELELAYAVTVHKSQGSEFPIVILPLFTGPKSLFNRSLLYTAVTRGKEMVIVAGRYDTLCNMVDNNRHQSFYCGLKTIIRSQFMEE